MTIPKRKNSTFTPHNSDNGVTINPPNFTRDQKFHSKEDTANDLNICKESKTEKYALFSNTEQGELCAQNAF